MINYNERIAVVTNAGRTRRDDLARAVRSRLEHFKRQTLQSVPQLVNHWAVAAFEDNILPISELIVLLRLVCKNVGAIVYGKLLLQLMSSAEEFSATDDEMSSM